MSRQDIAAVARIVWVEPVAFALHRDLPERTYSPKIRLLFWGLLASAAAVVVYLLVHGRG